MAMLSESIMMTPVKGKKGVATSAAQREMLHSVQMTDTLASISVKYGVTVSHLQKYNNFRQGDQLWARRELKIPLPDDYDCAANTSSTSEKKKRKSKSGKVKRTGKETPEHEESRSAQYNGDGESLTTAVTAAAADPDTWATKTEFAPVEVTNADSVDFLSNFDVDYLARKQAVTGTCTSPLRPIVKNKQCLDFLSKFDKSYSAVKAETEKHAVTKTSKTSLSGSARLSVTDSSILLARGAMQTYEGKLQAEDRAFGAIQRILTSDFEVVADDDVLETRNVGENELERDVEMYAL